MAWKNLQQTTLLDAMLIDHAFILIGQELNIY
jgi:hypothetical protein